MNAVFAQWVGISHPVEEVGGASSMLKRVVCRSFVRSVGACPPVQLEGWPSFIVVHNWLADSGGGPT